MDNPVGKTVGNFRIIELIGRGGMSSVYLAADEELQRSIALKIPHSKFLDDASFVKRFRREARAMARLRHPNIVQIYSVGNHEEIPFFAMEYVDGMSLAGILKEKGPLPTTLALDYIAQIARAVEYAHKMDIIHRDIKPANILVDSSGRLLVTDFGVSKMLSDDTSQDTMGFMGTPQYMSPEQCGQGTLDHRTDIYSLGAVLFEMLAGQVPFSSSSPAEAIKKHLFDAPEFPDEFKNKVPERVQSIVKKMLAKEPDQRYAHIPALLREIEKFEEECLEPTDPVLASHNGKSKVEDLLAHINARRPRWFTVVFAAVAVVCALGLSASFALSGGPGFRLASITRIFSGNQGTATDAAPTAVAVVSQTSVQPSSGASHTNGQAGEEPAGAVAKQNGNGAVTTIFVDSSPPGAAVFIDSEPRGTTPITLSAIDPGKHLLAMKLEGYADHVAEVATDTNAPAQVFHDFTAAQEAAQPRGSLVVESEPAGADVRINGERKGSTPFELPDMPTGAYSVEVRLAGYEDVRKDIELQQNETARLSFALIEKPKFGDLRINSVPAGADVLLDGAYKGTAPLTLRNVLVGTYEVVLKKEGYKTVARKISCKKNSVEQVDVTLTMTPEFAALQKVTAGDTFTQNGDLDGAIAAYEDAVALAPDTTAYRDKLTQARLALALERARELLFSYKTAYETEDVALLSSVLDEGNAEFFAAQVSNAEGLFREFGHIALTLSDITTDSVADDSVTVTLRLTMRASFAETDNIVDLLDAKRTLVVRRQPEIGWKICAIE